MNKLFLLLIPLLFFSCSSFEKQHFKARNFYNENKGLLAELCTYEFPSKTEYIKGKEVIKYDTITNVVPMLVDCPDGSKIECPKNKTIYKTITVTDTVIKPNTARESKLNNDINELQSNNTLLVKEKDNALKALKSNKWQKRGLVLLVVFLVVIILKK